MIDDCGEMCVIGNLYRNGLEGTREGSMLIQSAAVSGIYLRT